MQTSHLTSRHQLAEIGQLLSDPARTGMLLALLDGTVRPAGELAHMVGVAASTASAHLRRLQQGRLVAVHVQGRHRYYRLADERVAHLLETLGLLRDSQTQLNPVRRDATLAHARTCFDHLAGRLGVAVFESLRQNDHLRLTDHSVCLASSGHRKLRDVGLSCADAPKPKEHPGRCCVDLTERRFHLGGALGADLTARLFASGWLTRRRATRAVIVTAAGRHGFSQLGLPLNAINR